MERQYRITVRLEGAAFDPDPAPELARILREIADAVEGTGDLGTRRVRDVNGNTVALASTEVAS